MTKGYEYLEQPCRNFCFFKGILIQDPKDNKEKVVLSSFVAGGVGEVLIIDPESGEGETIKIPGDNGAWALFNYKNERLLVGTCGTYGYLHSLELKSRTWMPSLKLEGVTYIWDLAMASDGKVYGGTYPGCYLLRYDPDSHTLVNLGHMTKDPGNLYSRLVFTPVPGKVYVNCGLSTDTIGVYDIEKNEMSTVLDGCGILKADKKYLYIRTPEGNKLVHPETFEEIQDQALLDEATKTDERLPKPYGHVMKLSNGNTIGVCGQRLFILKPDDQKPTFMDVPCVPPPTEIFAMTCDDDGILWGATGLGQTMFRYDPKTGEYWNSDIVTLHGGEVYGIVSCEGKIFMTAYSGGDHIVYDPKKEWNRVDNINPLTLESVGPDYIRPQARSIIGPDNNIWTGWIARYGSYGLAITEINSKTYEVRKFTDLVPGQGIGWIAGDSENIYFTTNGSGNGLVAKTEEFYLVKMSKNGEILNKIKFPLGTHLSFVYACDDKVLLYTSCEGKSILHIYDPKTMEEIRSEQIDYGVGRMIPMIEGKILAFVYRHKEGRHYKALAVINSDTLSLEQETEIPKHTHGFCYNKKDGYIYFGQGSELYRIKYQ
ncbi:MAG: hypothetical protein ACOX3Q_01460 [Clostridia bacterium]|jgi:streptogramin lyase